MLVIALACVTATGESGQLTYSRGQNIVAAFEGWERGSDGTMSMVFSYFNRNYEEILDVPIGPANNIEPGGPDQGQPTHFLPGRHRFVFSVKVPRDWGPTRRLVWTLVVRGKTEKANAFLLPEWEINNQVRAQNGDGSGGGGGNAAEYNEAPKISVGAAQSITLPDAATLTAFVTDDGLPKPRAPRRPPAAATSGAATAAGGAAPPASLLRVNWIMFRGPVGAAVTFAPDRSPVTEGKAVTAARFSLPGQYVVRGYADDGAVTTPADIVVNVAPAK
jgi:hypothetical protein